MAYTQIDQLNAAWDRTKRLWNLSAPAFLIRLLKVYTRLK